MTATQSGTGCIVAVPIWQQWASKVKPVRVYACIIERRQQTGAFIIQWRNILLIGR